LSEHIDLMIIHHCIFTRGILDSLLKETHEMNSCKNDSYRHYPIELTFQPAHLTNVSYPL